jgi:hypothetical protein
MTRLVDWFGVEKLTRLGLEDELKLNPISIDGRKMIRSPAILRPIGNCS